MNKLKPVVLILLFCLSFAKLSGQNELRLPAIIGDNMVLQQKAIVPIWGWAAIGEEITVSTGWDNSEYKTQADENGKWMIKINTPSAGGPFSFKIKSNTEINFKNVMIGEVWLCSGQSNMEMPLRGWMETGQPVLGSEDAIANANYEKIRLFTVERNTSNEPLEDCSGQWEECESDLAKDFSAVGFFFGLSIYKKLNIPIGLIHSSWGGTPAEAWTKKKNLMDFEEFNIESTGVYQSDYQANLIGKHKKLMQQWAKSNGIDESENNWQNVKINTTKWTKIQVSRVWDETIIEGLTGIVWFRKSINIPEYWKGQDLIIELGPIDEMDISWFNEFKIGEHMAVSDWIKPRKYSIPSIHVNSGENQLAIKVINTSGAGGIYGNPEQLKIYPENDTTDIIFLNRNWKYRVEKELKDLDPAPYCDNCSDPQLPSVLFNAMINPIIPYAIKGAIWYQGESNRNAPDLYRKLFPAMIKCWRSNWDRGDFPFYYTQIAPFTYNGGLNSARLREAQLMALSVPNTGMAVTMDIGDLICIHPPDKKTVGERLALWALSKDYAYDNIIYSGPVYKKFKIEKDKIRIFFDYSGEKLKSDEDLSHFEIAGKNKVFYKARAWIDGKTVIVQAKNVNNPIAVRFAWSDTAEPNLFNSSGLPASSFRTDNWK